MALLTLHRKQRSKWAVPYWICINGCPLGLMRTPEVNMKMPAGTFTVEMKILFKVWKWTGGLGGRKTVTIGENDHLHIHITDRERWWNWLFNLDLVLWLVSFASLCPILGGWCTTLCPTDSSSCGYCACGSSGSVISNLR